MKKLLTFAFLVTAVMAWAQDTSLPGRISNTNFLAPSQESSGGAQPMFQPENTPLTQSSGAIAEAITPDIQALAANLDYNPTNIFNFVHDQIRYVHYFGSKKGAELTLLERSGNDFDQCALLSALLQASQFSPSYQFAMLQMPYDATNHMDLHHWLGLDFYNTNWTDTQNYFGYLTGTRGFPVWYTFPPDTNTIAFQRIWVTVAIGGTTYYLDPAFKISEQVTGVNLSSAMGLSVSNLWTAAGGTDNGSSVSGLTEGALRSALQNCNSNLLSYLSNSAPNAAVADIISGQQIVSSIGTPLSTSLAFPIFTNSSYPLLNWTNQPTNYMGTFSISFAGTNQTWLTPALEGQRISLTFSNNGVAQLWQDDSNILQIATTSTSNTIPVIFSATHPYGGNGYGGWNSTYFYSEDGGPLAGFDKSSTNLYQWTNSSYAIMYAFDPNPAWLKERQQKLNDYIAAGYPSSSRQVTTETLNVMGLGWMVQTELAHELLCQEWNQLPESQHRFGRMGQESGRGYYVDVYLQLDGTLPSTGFDTPDQTAMNQEFDISSYFWSAMEHGIIEQLQNSNIVGASTVKMLEIANTNGQTIYMASSSDWSTVSNNLVGYSSQTLSTLNNLISAGYILLLPKSGSNNVAGPGTWAGDGYVELGVSGSSRAMAMIIGGGYNGGYDSLAGAGPSATVVNANGQNQSTTFNPQSPTLQISPQTGADPVNMVDGTFQITASDLSLGEADPRGLNLTRYYTSERINSNPAGMGPGWLHSYYCNATALSDPEAGLGAETVEQMSPMIVATYAALNLYTNTGALDPKNWTTTALIAKWGIDQLINNAVSVNLGKDTVQFARQPNGSYTPPGNCTMTLLKTNSGFWLQERHGRTFKFGSTGLLTNIIDQYSQAMKFSYNSNNFVTNIVDWKGRSLNFTYTSGALTSVADNTGRSVYYAYTNSNGDLTSYTDPEGKTDTYLYDTNHELVATYDALNQLVETNSYDGFGHVTTQLTAGDTNKTWQVFASGYQTISIDPAGDATVYTYDDKSRLIAMQDGMGNLTQTFYDGQDHVIETISPAGETNQYFYDDNNNLIETIDPLGSSNVYAFDGNNNLIASTDADHHTSHFGYNAQFSLTGSTNGNGDFFTMVYNADGTLSNRTDSAGTTKYGYDTNGQLNSITYPSSLGSEGFTNNILGDPISHTDARNFITTFAYNKRRQLTITVAPTNVTTGVSFDANANVFATTNARSFVTTNSWSVTRHLLSTTLPATPQGTPVTKSTYDSRDWLASTQNPLSKTTYYTNDAAHRLIATTDPLQRTTTISYDQDSRPTNTTDAAQEPTSQRYDLRGSVIQIVDAATNIVGKAYDGAGNLICITNRNTNIWQFQYDGANRLTNTTSPLHYASGLVYNNRGLVQSTTDPKHQTTTFGYDARGRMTNKTDAVGTNTYQYDGNNNLTVLTNTGGPSLSWSYDAYNRVSRFTNAAGYVIQYQYDANGNLTNLIYPGNRNVAYAYDSLNRLTNVTDWAQRQTSYSYDLAGHLLSVTRPNNTMRSMLYDADGELTNIVEQATSKFPVAFYALHYNSAGRSDWEFKGPLPHPFTPPLRTNTYDADNRLQTFNGNTVSLDDDGNLTSGPLTNNTFGTYTYDARNELTSAGGISYGYDPAGNRSSLTNGANVATFVVNPNDKLPQVLMRIQNGVTNYFVYGVGLMYQVTETATSTNVLTYHFDSRGSTVAMTDASGNITDQVEYSPYGTITYRAGTNDLAFLFNGQFGVMTDPNGLLYMRSRYYTPYISRFLNPDPSRFGGGLNFYAFASGNPITQIDPFGMQSWMSPGYGALPNPTFPGGNPGDSAPIGYFVAGVGVGVVVAVVFVVAGPLVVAGGAELIITATAVTTTEGLGVSATTAYTISAATVTVGTGATAAYGGSQALGDLVGSAEGGNWNQVGWDAGTLTGGFIVGGAGGGQALGEGISGQPTSASSGLFGDMSLGYDPNYPNGSLFTWLASSPTPQSGAGVVGLTAGSAAQSSWFTPSTGANSSGQSSPIGKP